MMYLTVTELLRKVLKTLDTSTLYLEIKNTFFSSNLWLTTILSYQWNKKQVEKYHWFSDVKWTRLGHLQFGFCR